MMPFASSNCILNCLFIRTNTIKQKYHQKNKGTAREEKEMPAKKILIILSDANSIPITKPSDRNGNINQQIQQPTGFFLMELAKPLPRSQQ
jgi:hypothetical protein